MSHRVLTSALITLLCLCFRFSLSADESRMNVIFILVDDWGWTDGGSFGSDLYETPNIDRLAKEGMRFTDAYSACTVCSPTRAKSVRLKKISSVMAISVMGCSGG